MFFSPFLWLGVFSGHILIGSDPAFVNVSSIAMSTIPKCDFVSQSSQYLFVETHFNI